MNPTSVGYIYIWSHKCTAASVSKLVYVLCVKRKKIKNKTDTKDIKC